MNVQFGAKIVGLTRENFTKKEASSIDPSGDRALNMAKAVIAAAPEFSDAVTPDYTVQFEKRCPKKSDTFGEDYIPVSLLKGDQLLGTWKAPIFHGFTNRPEFLHKTLFLDYLNWVKSERIEERLAEFEQAITPELKKKLRAADDVVGWINYKRPVIENNTIMPPGPLSWETIHQFVDLLNQFRKAEITQEALLAQEKALAESLRPNP